VIRRFAPSDTYKLSALIQNTLVVSNSGDYDIETIHNLTKIFTPRMLKSAATKREVYVYERSGETFGTISLDGNRIYSFFVAPDKQGMGVGKELLEYTERRARRMGIRTLHVAASLTAVAFYRRMGYTCTGTQEDESYGKTVDMSKAL
jgi:GNAT superfamily N-acetyltransferase